MSKPYKIDRLRIITYRYQKKKTLRDLRCRYLAKSQLVKCNAQRKKIIYVNFRGSHFKKVSFNNSELFGCDFWGTSFNNCSFRNAVISDCVFTACRFKNCDFTGAVFYYSLVVNTGLDECKGIDISKGIIINKKYPKSQSSTELQEALEVLKSNSNIRKNKLLHLPGNKYNELNIFLLQKNILSMNCRNCFYS